MSEVADLAKAVTIGWENVWQSKVLPGQKVACGFNMPWMESFQSVIDFKKELEPKTSVICIMLEYIGMSLYLVLMDLHLVTMFWRRLPERLL